MSRKGANKYTAYTFISDTHKQCSLCQTIKEHTAFHKDKNNKHGKGLAYYCKECANQKSRNWHNKTKGDPEYWDRKRNSYFKMTYGISLEDRTELLDRQDNACAICGVKLSESGTHTHVDHCHTTGKVRAILCTNCNRGLGYFQDNPELLIKASDYLKHHSVSEDDTKEVTT